MLSQELFLRLTDLVDREVVERAGRQLVLSAIDDTWSDYLANVAELKDGIHWVSLGGRDPLYEFLIGERAVYADFSRYLSERVSRAFESVEIIRGELHFQNQHAVTRGATWTYVITDQPFGTLGERLMMGLRKRLVGK